MCGRFTLAYEDFEWMYEYFHVEDNGFRYPPRYNIAPGQDVVAIISDGQKRRMGLLKWGLIPSWSQTGKTRFKTFNARAETLLVKPTFKHLVSRKRCLIPADGFFEWHRNTRRPHRIRLKKRDVFAFAGLYDTWRGPNGETVSSCTIITCQPNWFMASIHNRMPVILSREAEDIWLDRGTTAPEIVTSVLRPTEEEMYAYPVNPAVGNVQNDGPDCVEEHIS
jgi:putative SOS response-associated peptidase YedK